MYIENIIEKMAWTDWKRFKEIVLSAPLEAKIEFVSNSGWITFLDNYKKVYKNFYEENSYFPRIDYERIITLLLEEEPTEELILATWQEPLNRNLFLQETIITKIKLPTSIKTEMMNSYSSNRLTSFFKNPSLTREDLKAYLANATEIDLNVKRILSERGFKDLVEEFNVVSNLYFYGYSVYKSI